MEFYFGVYLKRTNATKWRSLFTINEDLIQNLFDIAYRSKQAMSDHYEWRFAP